jgi:hypothetical protein
MARYSSSDPEQASAGAEGFAPGPGVSIIVTPATSNLGDQGGVHHTMVNGCCFLQAPHAQEIILPKAQLGSLERVVEVSE